jgi:hypothetical protein
MMKTIRRTGVLVAAALCTVVLSTATSLPAQGDSPRPSPDAVPGVAPASAQTLRSTDIYLDEKGNRIPTPEASKASTAGSGDVAAKSPCTPDSGRDNPHASATAGDVSGHGWWNKGTCTKPTAKVQNCLYEWYTDNTWRQKDCSPKKTLKPGGGSSRRTNARNTCVDTVETDWRNHVDVDVIDESDTGENKYRQATINCRVY